MPVKVFDANGNEKTWDWLKANFGDVLWHEAPAGDAFRLVELRDSGDHAPAVITVKVLDAHGAPMPNVNVCRWWPDNTLKSLPAYLQGCKDVGIYGPTNAEGNIGFGLGRGDFYFPPKGGASIIWVGQSSDCAGLDGDHGLGMLGRTDHRHLDATFQLVLAPQPQPDPNPYEPTALGVVVLDDQGMERDAAWLYSQYGRVEVHRGASGGYCVTTLQEAHGGPLTVTLFDELALPSAGVEVALRARAGTGGGQTVITDGTGKAEFPLSNVHKYSAPGEQGPFLAVARDAASDAVFGLGWVRNTDRHLNVTMGWDACDDEEPAPEPGSSTLSDLLADLAGVMAEALDLIEDIQAELD